ncbi:hypothetical protein SEA_DEXDERT_5 [Gordonia phage Dexdert]|uniref:Uncharacterized protein n=1 Tax=Gordonia phage Dexdert TaxID=2794946 RepID=A0A7T1KS32_9CAUD|nr:hypothetical protein J1597_gp05 [Gordonia phage Dexdert]QPO17002.1 hypothetical protein SEA_DEXDERT_5 [Gordonia phage Dexdert]
MAGYQPRRRPGHADAGRPFPYDQVRPPAGGGGVYRSGPGKVRREFIDRAALAAAAEAARIERRAREAERRKSTARLEQIAYPDGVPRRDPKPSKPAEQFEDWGSSEWYGVDGLVPDVFTRAFASIREHITAWWCALAFTIVMIVGSQTDWAVMLACLAGVSAVAGTVAIIVGRRQYRRQLAAEHAAIAARADEQHHQWMNDPDAWRRQIEGNER